MIPTNPLNYFSKNVTNVKHCQKMKINQKQQKSLPRLSNWLTREILKFIKVKNNETKRE